LVTSIAIAPGAWTMPAAGVGAGVTPGGFLPPGKSTTATGSPSRPMVLSGIISTVSLPWCET
jgi:hypothetical protein